MDDMTRRTFVRTISSLSALGGLSTIAPYASAGMLDVMGHERQFAYVASSSNVLHVFTIERDGRWVQIQQVVSARPSTLVLSPDQRFLYVANSVESFAHRPSASVESYAIDSTSGLLTLLNRQALALFSTQPTHLAMAHDGRRLAVVAGGGKAYDLLSIGTDGALGPVTASIRQMGEAQALSAPNSALFHRDGTLLASHQGADQLSSLAVADDGALSIAGRYGAMRGAGPGSMAASHQDDLIYIAGVRAPLLTSLRYDAGSPQLLREVHEISLPHETDGATALLGHPSEPILFVAARRGISLVRTHRSGELERAGHYARNMDGPVAMAVTVDGNHLLLADQLGGSITRFEIDLKYGRIADPVEVLQLGQPRSLVVKRC